MIHSIASKPRPSSTRKTPVPPAGRTHSGVVLLSLLFLGVAAAPARPQSETTSMASLVAGTAVPRTIRLKELTPEWRRLTVTGEAMLGMGGMVQSMLQGVGSMFGGAGGASDALYTRGATIKMGDQEFLIGYRLPAQGVDFGALMAIGTAGKGTPSAPPNLPRRPPISPDTELSLVLVNLRAIAAISDIRPFDMAEALRPAPPGFLDSLFNQAKEKAPAAAPHPKP